MKKYDVWALAISLGGLTAIWKTFQKTDRHGVADMENEDLIWFLRLSLTRVLESARRINADPSLLGRIEDLLRSCGDYPKADIPLDVAEARRPAVLASNIESIILGIENNLKSRLFMYIPSDQATYYDNGDILGAEVRGAFPASSLEEILLAGDCYAAGLWTASVFHSMRFAEHGLRRLAKTVDVKLIYNKKPIPIEYATWNKVIGGLRTRIEAERKKNKSARVERRMEWFASLADHCEYMKDIWRNSVAHSGRLYNKPDALSAIDRVRAFSQKLVAGVPR